MVLLLAGVPELLELYKSYKNEFSVVAFGLAVVVGMISEGASTFIEVSWDKKYDKKWNITDNWYKYLAASYETEPVGYRYIATKVTTMYFEFGMMWFFLVGGLGWTCAIYKYRFEALSCWVLVIPVLSFLWAWYFLYLAKKSHKLLCLTRRKINEINGK